MSDISFPKEDTELLVSKLQTYCQQELDVDIGDFDAGFLLDFIAKELGGYFYNQGVYDAQTVLQHKVDEIADTLLQLEKPLR